MSDQFPPGEEPTRMSPGGGPDPQQPNPQQPKQWGPPQQSPYDPTREFSQPQDPNQWGPPQQSPYAGQPSWGAPQDPYAQQNPYAQQGQQQWAQPGQPGQQWAQQPPNNKKNAMIIGGIVAAVLLIVGGIGAAIALGDDGDEDKKAGDSPGLIDQPTGEPSDVPSVEPSVPPSDGPTDGLPTEPATPTAPESSTAPAGSFTAEYSSDVAQVCTGAAMSNAKPFTPENAGLFGYVDTPKEPDWSGFVSVGLNEPFEVAYPDFLDVTIVACVTGVPSAEAPPTKCETEDSKGKKVTFTYAPYDYTPVFREAATGQVLFEGTKIGLPFEGCPMFAFIDDTGEYTPSADGDSIDADLTAWLKKQ